MKHPVPFLGAGIGYRSAYRDRLLSATGPRPAVLEVMPEHFLGAEAAGDTRALEALCERYPIVMHAVSLSLGTAFRDGHLDAHARDRWDRVCSLARRVRPRFVSDHLALCRSPAGIDVGHLMPLPLTDESLALVATRVTALAEACDAPVLIENIARPFAFVDDRDEAAFLRELCARTGCGLLLDLTNLLYNARNLGFDPVVALDGYPLAEVRSVHLAGGVQRPADGFWVDSHSRPVDADALALLSQLKGRAPLETIIIERDSRLPALDDLCAEAAQAAALWTS